MTSPSTPATVPHSLVKSIIDRQVKVRVSHGNRKPRASKAVAELPPIPAQFLRAEYQPGRPTGMGFTSIKRRELAKVIGMDEGQLGRVMSGERQLTVWMVEEIAEAFGGVKKGWGIDTVLLWWKLEMRKAHLKGKYQAERKGKEVDGKGGAE